MLLHCYSSCYGHCYGRNRFYVAVADGALSNKKNVKYSRVKVKLSPKSYRGFMTKEALLR